MEAEGEKKRKRTDDGRVGGGGGRRKKDREAEAAAESATEEEVEEFFAILRRMRVAVKYFEKGKVNGNDNGDRRKSTGRSGSASSEAGALGGTDGVKKAGEETVSVVREKGVFDLNAVPEPESTIV